MLEIRNLHKTFYPGTPEENRVFSGFDLTIEEGTTTAILGPNGCGKSTLFSLIAGGLKPDEGEILLSGTNLTKLPEEKRAKLLSRVAQDPSMGVSPSLSILENMSLAFKKHESFTLGKLLKPSRIPEIRERLKDVRLGLEDKLNTQVKFLSGGQRQSLGLIMATLVRPELLLLDEHTAALDPKTSQRIMEMTQEISRRDQLTTLMITHNLRHAIAYADRVIMLSRGRIVFDSPAKGLTEEELTKIYHEKIEEEMHA